MPDELQVKGAAKRAASGRGLRNSGTQESENSVDLNLHEARRRMVSYLERADRLSAKLESVKAERDALAQEIETWHKPERQRLQQAVGNHEKMRLEWFEPQINKLTDEVSRLQRYADSVMTQDAEPVPRIEEELHATREALSAAQLQLANSRTLRLARLLGRVTGYSKLREGKS
ncbi:hypothetical protein [Asticcacaulis tiandongensis]|uniref:hypothetical protein n=1 Tax=Asticcacaulis tiandongensis TaxID=2565365 RepID=UPI001128FDE5|nr:hypothetical protein [Asticcacaulis tiandongensis]